MNILELMTKQNIRIIELIDRIPLHIREIADALKISPGTVHKLSKKLIKNKMAEEIQKKNRKTIKLNNDHLLIKEIKKIINLNKLINSAAYKNLKKIGSVGIYGSFANGTNDSESDLDIWIKTNTKKMELIPLIRQLEQEIKIKVNLLILTKNKIEQLREKDLEFYTRLILTSIGDRIDN